MLKGKGNGGHKAAPGKLVSCVNIRCGMAETADARRQAGTANDRVIERFHKPVHDRGLAKRVDAILDFRVNGMPVSVPNRDEDHVNVLEFRVENIRAKRDAVAGQRGEVSVGRQAFRLNMERHVRHGSPAWVSCAVIGA
ncbi:hypothetical protein I7824_01845 [Burkholderia seminalis]|nr:hypothetical protein [Burkholderia seminalis]